MITKKAVITLTKEEIESPEEIELLFQVLEEGNEEGIDYRINYPKT